ncbi:MAG: hypothetical protein PHI18_10265 [bacterium]|nr:hypothetical protein [bacterium]
MKSGFIKLPRAIFELLENPRRFTRTEALVDLFRRANFRTTRLTIHEREIEIAPGELLFTLPRLAASWQWSADEVDEFIVELERAAVLVRRRRGAASVLFLQHDGGAWRPLDSLPKNVLSSSSQEEQEENESSQERDPLASEWAEFLRETILNRRLSGLNRARLDELRAEFEAARATSSRGAA